MKRIEAGQNAKIEWTRQVDRLDAPIKKGFCFCFFDVVLSVGAINLQGTNNIGVLFAQKLNQRIVKRCFGSRIENATVGRGLTLSVANRSAVFTIAGRATT